MSDTQDELRIIAKDAHLDTTDRAVLDRAAAELEWFQRALIQTQAALIEAQQRQIATNEQLLAARRLAPKPNDPIWVKFYSGPLTMREFKL